MTELGANALAALAELTAAWQPTRQLADAAGLSPAAAGAALDELRRAGIAVRRHTTGRRRRSEWRLAPRPERTETIVRMRDAGYTMQQCGDRFGITRARVSQILAALA